MLKAQPPEPQAVVLFEIRSLTEISQNEVTGAVPNSMVLVSLRRHEAIWTRTPTSTGRGY